MSVIEKTPIDPFSAVNFDEIIGNDESLVIQPEEIIDTKDSIKKAAEQSKFSSRQSKTPKKQKLIKKSFSIFSEEANIIKKALNAHSDILEEEFGSPSQSDVVRAGLHLLAEKSPKEQAMLIAKHKGRGRT
ncbi:MAG: hypothetical protein K6L76_01830 [Agarilytica sp.]